MRPIYIIVILLLSFTSCKSSKQNISTSKKPPPRTTVSNIKKASLADNIVAYSETFKGVKYKYAGTDRKGLDCSGLIYLAYKNEGITVPRVSYIMAKEGRPIRLHNVIKGDLLFFKTNKNSKRINHVGLVVAARRGVIEFIHSTSSKGVITSKLSEVYWNDAFIEARRIL